MTKEKKIHSKCEICGKKVKVWPHKQPLCKVHELEKRGNDYALLAETIIHGSSSLL